MRDPQIAAGNYSLQQSPESSKAHRLFFKEIRMIVNPGLVRQKIAVRMSRAVRGRSLV